VIVIHEALLTAVHLQFASAVTLTVPVPAAAPCERLAGEIAYVQVVCAFAGSRVKQKRRHQKGSRQQRNLVNRTVMPLDEADSLALFTMLRVEV
jgi:hypothetical protein